MISFWAAKDQNTRIIDRLKYFYKLGWRNEKNWGWNQNLIPKLKELFKFKDLIKLITSLIDLFKDLIE
jgi:hypothetical protein